MRKPSQSRGFTLIELLVVIAVMAVLIGLLIPAISRIHYDANVTKCASNIGQICAALDQYAASNDGWFPDDDILQGTGANVWDNSNFFCDALSAQGVKPLTFLCPLDSDLDGALSEFYYYGYFRIIQYNVWIPRLNGSDTIPPSPTYGGGRFLFPSPRPTKPFAGPKRLRDFGGQNNPVVTDIVSSSGVNPPANPNVSQSANPYNIGMYHIDSGRLMGTNQGFSDGHVEVHGPESLRPYYFGNYWNWR